MERRRNTEQFKLRPSSELVEELRTLAPKLGYATANELAVDLMQIGLHTVRDGTMPSRQRELRAKLSPGEAAPGVDPAVKAWVLEQVEALRQQLGSAKPGPAGKDQGR